MVTGTTEIDMATLRSDLLFFGMRLILREEDDEDKRKAEDDDEDDDEDEAARERPDDVDADEDDDEDDEDDKDDDEDEEGGAKGSTESNERVWSNASSTRDCLLVIAGCPGYHLYRTTEQALNSMFPEYP